MHNLIEHNAQGRTQFGGQDPTWSEKVYQKYVDIIANLEADRERVHGPNYMEFVEHDEFSEEIEQTQFAQNSILLDVMNVYNIMYWIGYFYQKAPSLVKFVVDNLKEITYNPDTTTDFPEIYEADSRPDSVKLDLYIRLKDIHPLFRRMFLEQVQSLSNIFIEENISGDEEKKFGLVPDRDVHKEFFDIWNHMFDLGELDFASDSSNNFPIFEAWIRKSHSDFPKVYSILFQYRMQLNISFNSFKSGAGKKLLDTIKLIQEEKKRIIKESTIPIEAEYQKILSEKEPDPVAAKILLLKDHITTFHVKIVPNYQSDYSFYEDWMNKSKGIAAWLNVDMQDEIPYANELLDMLEGEANKLVNKDLVCDDEVDPTTQMDIKTFQSDDIIKIWFPNKSEPTCYSRSELLKFLRDPDNIRADWVQKRDSDVLLNDPDNITGKGGEPGTQRFYKLPASFTLYIPESDVNLFDSSTHNSKEYLLVKHFDIRVGNTDGGTLVVSGSHGQDMYPIFKVFDKYNPPLNNQYLIGHMIEENVFSGYDDKNNKIVAIKQLIDLTDKWGNPTEQYKIALNEIEIMKKLKLNNQCNEYVVCYLDNFKYEGRFFIVTEYIDGCNLSDLNLLNFRYEDIIFKFIKEIAEAIEFIHTNGVVHEDIRPLNIMYDRRNNRYKLINFGFSCTGEICQRTGKYLIDVGIDYWKIAEYFSFGLTIAQQFIGQKFLDDPLYYYALNKPQIKEYSESILSAFPETDFWVTKIAVGLLNPTPLERMTTKKVLNYLDSIRFLIDPLDYGTEIFQAVRGRPLCKLQALDPGT